MKKDLDHLPLKKQRELARIVQILCEEFEDATKLATTEDRKAGRIQKIILYGSYARGTYVEDHQSGYYSDYDILIIVNQNELTDMVKIWAKAETRLMHDPRVEPLVQIIVHTLNEVNDALVVGKYFFRDIKDEGIELYGMRGVTLAEPKDLSPQELYEQASEHYETWYPSLKDFMKGYEYALQDGALKKSIFDLHQATERAYGCMLLIITNYRPRTHNIEFLRSQCERHYGRLIHVWPRDTHLCRSRFQKLKRAYIEARYSKHYSISKEELEWLGERVKDLLDQTSNICHRRLEILKQNI